jgi:cytochrome c peroxidase
MGGLPTSVGQRWQKSPHAPTVLNAVFSAGKL